MKLLGTQETADLFGCSLKSIYKKSWRAEMMLPAVYIGNLMKFDMRDIEAAIERRKEKLPLMPSSAE